MCVLSLSEISCEVLIFIANWSLQGTTISELSNHSNTLWIIYIFYFVSIWSYQKRTQTKPDSYLENLRIKSEHTGKSQHRDFILLLLSKPESKPFKISCLIIKLFKINSSYVFLILCWDFSPWFINHLALKLDENTDNWHTVFLHSPGHWRHKSTHRFIL